MSRVTICQDCDKSLINSSSLLCDPCTHKRLMKAAMKAEPVRVCPDCGAGLVFVDGDPEPRKLRCARSVSPEDWTCHRKPSPRCTVCSSSTFHMVSGVAFCKEHAPRSFLENQAIRDMLHVPVHQSLKDFISEMIDTGPELKVHRDGVKFLVGKLRRRIRENLNTAVAHDDEIARRQAIARANAYETALLDVEAIFNVTLPPVAPDVVPPEIEKFAKEVVRAVEDVMAPKPKPEAVAYEAQDCPECGWPYDHNSDCSLRLKPRVPRPGPPRFAPWQCDGRTTKMEDVDPCEGEVTSCVCARCLREPEVEERFLCCGKEAHLVFANASHRKVRSVPFERK